MLSKMETIPQTSGKILHEIAAELVAEGSMPAKGVLARRYEVRMLAAYAEALTGAYQADPKHKINLFEVYYGLPNPRDRLGQTISEGRVAAENLRSSRSIARARRHQVLAAERLEEFNIGNVPVFCKTDLATKDPVTGLIYLTDYKTSANNSPRRESEDREQLAFYGRAATLIYGVPAQQVRLTLSMLHSGTEDTWASSDEEVAGVDRLVLRRAATIRSQLQDQTRNAAPRIRFPETSNPKICASCVFYHVCKGRRRLGE
jgi:hypothetical protein